MDSSGNRGHSGPRSRTLALGHLGPGEIGPACSTDAVLSLQGFFPDPPPQACCTEKTTSRHFNTDTKAGDLTARGRQSAALPRQDHWWLPCAWRRGASSLVWLSESAQADPFPPPQPRPPPCPSRCLSASLSPASAPAFSALCLSPASSADAQGPQLGGQLP